VKPENRDSAEELSCLCPQARAVSWAMRAGSKSRKERREDVRGSRRVKSATVGMGRASFRLVAVSGEAGAGMPKKEAVFSMRRFGRDGEAGSASPPAGSVISCVTR
jgi:hypothetical protein